MFFLPRHGQAQAGGRQDCRQGCDGQDSLRRRCEGKAFAAPSLTLCPRRRHPPVNPAPTGLPERGNSRSGQHATASIKSTKNVRATWAGSPWRGAVDETRFQFHARFDCRPGMRGRSVTFSGPVASGFRKRFRPCRGPACPGCPSAEPCCDRLLTRYGGSTPGSPASRRRPESLAGLFACLDHDQPLVRNDDCRTSAALR